MINSMNMFANNDNPLLKMGTHTSEKLTETAFNSISAFADSLLKFNQTLSKCKNPQDLFTAASTLAQENTAAAISATQKTCSTFLETFSEMGGQCASALESTAETFNGLGAAGISIKEKAKKRDKE